MKYLWLACLLCFPPSLSPFFSQEINVHIAFGYKDARPLPFVSDLFEKAYLIELLTKPCRAPADHACGFRRDPDDGDLLSREVRSKNGRSFHVQLHITASAAGPDDDENRRDPFQAVRSRMSEKNFLNGISHADATFYVGHSRDGGGPDFQPPQLTNTQHINYGFYRRAKPGLGKMLTALRQSASLSRQKLGLISCGSSRWFGAPIRAASPQADLTTVDGLIYYSDGLQQLLKLLARDLDDFNLQ